MPTATEPEQDEATKNDNAALALLEGAEAPPAQAQPEKKSKKRKGPRPPAGLEEEVIEVALKLTQVSLGKPISNIQATLTWELQIPNQPISELMGEQAYVAVFNGGLVGEGIVIKDEKTVTDPQNRRIQSFRTNMPRLESSGKVDQISRCVLPLVTDHPELVAPMLDLLDPGWRLNLPCGIEGVLRLHPQQQSMALTSTAGDDPGTTREPIEE